MSLYLLCLFVIIQVDLLTSKSQGDRHPSHPQRLDIGSFRRSFSWNTNLVAMAMPLPAARRHLLKEHSCKSTFTAHATRASHRIASLVPSVRQADPWLRGSLAACRRAWHDFEQVVRSQSRRQTAGRRHGRAARGHRQPERHGGHRIAKRQRRGRSENGGLHGVAFARSAPLSCVARARADRARS